MEGAEIPGTSRNIWNLPGTPGRNRNTCRKQEYREEIGIYGGRRNTGKK